MVDSKHSAHMVTGFRTVESSEHARRTLQPINDLADNMKPSRSTKTNLRLSIGDPTVDGNLKVPENATKSLVAVVSSEEHNGYPPTTGYQDTKEVVAQYCSQFCPTTSLNTHYFDWNNVIMTSGVSHGIVLAISALCNEGDNILVGAPAFPHYKTVCDSYGVECRFYPLNPASNWESDLTVAEHLVDANTKALVMINPSNPCGSNFSRSHVEEIVHFCEHHQLPIISDEIYAELVLHGGVFTSVADIPSAVPRMLLSGTAKYQVNPGWRLGWAMLVDPTNAASEWLTGMKQLAQLLAGPNSLAQVSLAQTLLETPVTSTRAIIGQLEAGATCYNRLLEHDIGISFDPPSASMFVMLHIDYSYYKDISSDTEFYEKLLDEENVQVLPGTIFGVHGFVRATISRPTAILNEAIIRIIEFCERHKK